MDVIDLQTTCTTYACCQKYLSKDGKVKIQLWFGLWCLIMRHQIWCRLAINMNSDSYCSVLEADLNGFVLSTVGGTFLFQYGIATCQTSSPTKPRLDAKDLVTTPWPAKLQELNPIGNLWSRLARSLYKNQRQFDTGDELEKCILESWSNISLIIIRSFFQFMQTRYVAAINNGGKICAIK